MSETNDIINEINQPSQNRPSYQNPYQQPYQQLQNGQPYQQSNQQPQHGQPNQQPNQQPQNGQPYQQSNQQPYQQPQNGQPYQQPDQQPQNGQPYQQPQNGQSYQQPYQQSQNGQPYQRLPQYQQPQLRGLSPYQQPQYTDHNMYQQHQSNNNPGGLAIASMICGIVGLCFSCCLWFLSFPVAIVGLILGIISIRNHQDGKGMAIAGVVTSAITILLALLVIFGLTAFSNYFWDEVNRASNTYY